MSVICGILHPQNNNPSTGVMEEMLRTLNHWGADAKGNWANNNIELGHLMLWNTPESLHETLPFHDNTSGLTITSDARIDNRKELLNLLDCGLELNASDSRFILKAYQKWGYDCPKYLIGDYAFAIWDEQQQQLFCARDHLGVKPFYYYYENDLFAFASEIKGILALPDIKHEANEIWIADFLIRRFVDRNNTMYKQIQRLEPGHSVLVKEGKATITRYWQLDATKELEPATDEEYINGFRQRLEEAVNCRLRSHYKVGTELSGGLDSSAIVGHLHQQLSKIGKTFFAYHLKPSLDESYAPLSEVKYAESLANSLKLQNLRMIDGTEKGMVEALSWNLKVQDEPMREMNGMFRDSIFEACKADDCRVLFSGFGGDDMVSMHANAYTRELAAIGQWKRCWTEVKLKSKLRDKSPYIKMASILLGSLLGKVGITPGSIKTAISNRDKIDHQKYKERRNLQPEFAERINAVGRLKESIKKYTYDGNLREGQIKRMEVPHNVIRLETCDIAARSFKIEYRYPLWDVRLIEYYLALPPHMKAQQGCGRYIFRKASEHLAPHSVIWRADETGSSNPHIFNRAAQDIDEVINTLMSIPPESKYHQYADNTKFAKKRDVKLKEHTLSFHRFAPVFNNIILADKLRNVS